MFAQQIGQRTEKCRAEPRVLHFDAGPAGGTVRLLHKGEIIQALPLRDVHAIAFDEAEPCTVILVYGQPSRHAEGAAGFMGVMAPSGDGDSVEKRLLLDFSSAEDNSVFR